MPFLAAALLAQVALAPLVAQTPLRLTYLGNMGVLLEHAGKRVVIDGFHRGALADYASVPPTILTALESAAEPYRRIDLALTTHRHLDHFDHRAVAARLAADSTIVYLAARETVDSLVARSAVSARDPRIRAVVPPNGGAADLTLNGVAVRVLDLPHNATPTATVANVGFIVDLGGIRVLHVGDANPDRDRYRGHRLNADPVDVAVLPYWYFLGRNRAALLAAIPARHYVASHIGPTDTTKVSSELAGAIDNLTLLLSPGAVVELAGTR
ncbi:MAG: MBL fold metallo-hydrolase [Gemmatimonadetes bacterium]|nr:MBL fold metallo-hydrolase [Gemmatimonadota bacterium]